MAANTLAPGYRAAYRHPGPRSAFADVGPQLWRCRRCGGRATYSRPLDVEAADDPNGPYSHRFIHRGGCPQ